MGETHGDLVRVLLSLAENDLLQLPQLLQNLPDLLLQIQPAVHLALVVAASGGVELFHHIPTPLNQTALHTLSLIHI